MRIATGLLVVLLALGSLGGCAGTDPVRDVKRFFQREGKPRLDSGIRYYERGRYQDALESIQDALRAGLENADQVTAHKYLALIHCLEDRNRQCRAHFRTALELDPSFELRPAEADDPRVARAFQQAKPRVQKK